MNDNLFLTLIGTITIGALFLGHPVALTFGGLGIILGLLFIGPATLPISYCDSPLYFHGLHP